MKGTTQRIYLDYAATTPVDPAVLRAIKPYFSERFGNAGSLHSFGQEAIAAVDRSREVVAKAIGAEFREIIFTSSATEANNLALRGVVKATLRECRALGEWQPRIIVSAIEHESVLETARALEKEGVEVVYLPVNKTGIVDLEKLKASMNENTVLVSVMYVNNEIGTVQPIVEIAKIVEEFRGLKIIDYGLLNGESAIPAGGGSASGGRYPLFHTDATQAFQFFDCDVDKLGVDLMTLSSHKIYGPKGAAALYVANSQWGIANRKTPSISIIKPLPIGHWLNPMISGGGQEFGFRSGTENVPAIVGFAKAVKLFSYLSAVPSVASERRRELENKKIAVLRDRFWCGTKKIFPIAKINGITNYELRIEKSKLKNPQSAVSDPQFSPHILNIYFPGHDAQDILTRLDLAGVAASSGSACRSRAMESSYVIEALGYSKERAKSSVRFSFGRPTTKKEIDATLTVLKEILK